ncbi:MAG: FAD-dependent oxidoreductase [Chitinophagales bacterium]
MKKNISIAGCGVIGLTTAIKVAGRRYEVRIVTRDWSMHSYKKFEALAEVENSGVHMTPILKMGNEVNEMEQRIRTTLREEKFLPLRKEELRGGFNSGWYIQVPLIETPVYLPYLLNEFMGGGGKIIRHTLLSLEELPDDSCIVINCTGLASRELAYDDEVIPVRGRSALLKTKNLHRIILEDISPTYIVYREDGCICGGTYEMNGNEEVTNPETLQKIIERCIALEPQLQSATLIDSWAGLRPFRAGMRVEIEKGKPLIHNYGHGGSGFTVSWGCAEEVVKLFCKME